MRPSDELVELTATEAVALLRKGEVTPLELIDAAAARIEAVEKQVNALPIRFLEGARGCAAPQRRGQARGADARLARGPSDRCEERRRRTA